MQHILKNISPNLAEMLPLGAMQEIAEKHEVHYTTVSDLLKGKRSSAKVRAILDEAIAKIAEDIQKRSEYVEDVKTQLDLTSIDNPTK